MRRYLIDRRTGLLRFFCARGLSNPASRLRRPRIRAQKLYERFGGKPFLPFRIAHYPTPTFYYSDLMRHRRKHDLDDGVSKVKHRRTN